MRWAEFLENTPPNTEVEIEDLYDMNACALYELKGSDIQIHCKSDKCGGKRIFGVSVQPSMNSVSFSDINITYVCKNCSCSYKYYALRVWPDRGPGELFSPPGGRAMKFGEAPPFGPILPPRVMALVGPDRENFLKGRRSEVQGLGVGAFAYYRQVVERQKGRLLGEIKKVAIRLGADTEAVQAFDRAIAETQFSKAVEDVKEALPPSLLIDGHNPMTLLHSALSEGLHAGTDEECLELAQDIRVILSELAERISLALKEEAELKQSLSRLLNRSKNKG